MPNPRMAAAFLACALCAPGVARAGSTQPHGQVTVCEVSYMACGLTGKETSGLRDKDFVTQGQNAEMVEECERYVVL